MDSTKMALTISQKSDIFDLLSGQIIKKLSGYSPETSNMPFHTRLLGKDRMALFSFIQSVNTTLGTSVFEQVAAIIAKPHFNKSINQYKKFNNTISVSGQQIIQEIVDELKSMTKKPDKSSETTAILKVAQNGTLKKIKRPRIDLFLETSNGVEYYFDLKTAKPNMGEIVGFKRTLLEWVAIRGALNPKVQVRTLLAIPYNPYEPEPYQRWTFQGMFDLPNEIMVADEFWDFLGGKNTYEQLLKVFEDVGIALRPKIDAKFKTFSVNNRRA